MEVQFWTVFFPPYFENEDNPSLFHPHVLKLTPVQLFNYNLKVELKCTCKSFMWDTGQWWNHVYERTYSANHLKSSSLERLLRLIWIRLKLEWTIAVLEQPAFLRFQRSSHKSYFKTYLHCYLLHITWLIPQSMICQQIATAN